MDFGKFKYEERKKKQTAKKRQHVVLLKEIRLRPRTEKHDLEFKINHAREFLAEGHKVQLTMQFKGRENAHKDIGRGILESLVKGMEDVAKTERGILTEGRLMSLILAPKVPVKAAGKAPKAKAPKAAAAPSAGLSAPVLPPDAAVPAAAASPPPAK